MEDDHISMAESTNVSVLTLLAAYSSWIIDYIVH